MLVSQSANPPLQAYSHVPKAQPVAVVLAGASAAQSMPQPPQLARSASVLVSQPSVAARFRSPLQSVHPESQVCSQAPRLHTGLELAARSSHTVPQPPQFDTSETKSVSQPSRLTFSSALQSPQPAKQAMLQLPPVQVGVPFAVLQASLHPPQLVQLAFRSASQPSLSTPLQLPQPESHAPSTQSVAPQNPLPWANSVVQSLPQPLQLVGSKAVLVSQPSRAMSSSALQSLQPDSQVSMLHTLAAHSGVPWMKLQDSPQPPQFAVLASTEVSQPSRAVFSFALQSSQPGLQVMLQVEFKQVGVPLTVLQGCPQNPQPVMSLRRSVSQPGAEVQSPKPVSQEYAQLPMVQLVACMLVGALATQLALQAPQLVSEV